MKIKFIVKWLINVGLLNIYDMVTQWKSFCPNFNTYIYFYYNIPHPPSNFHAFSIDILLSQCLFCTGTVLQSYRLIMRWSK